ELDREQLRLVLMQALVQFPNLISRSRLRRMDLRSPQLSFVNARVGHRYFRSARLEQQRVRVFERQRAARVRLKRGNIAVDISGRFGARRPEAQPAGEHGENGEADDFLHRGPLQTLNRRMRTQALVPKLAEYQLKGARDCVRFV